MYTFHLRETARWSDGAPITATTFRNAWMRVLRPDTGAPYVGLLFCIAGALDFYEGRVTADEVGIQALDPATLRVVLQQPTPFFLQLTAMPAYMPVPEHTLARFGAQWALPEHIVVNGAFALDAWEPDVAVRLVKNPRYWGQAEVELDQIEFLVMQDQNRALQTYLDSEIQWLSGVVSPYAAEVLQHPDLLRFPILSTYYYNCNLDHPALADVRVRQALYLALNRNYLCRVVLSDGDLPAFGLVPARIPDYPNYIGQREDPERARQLLREAGYADGVGFPPLNLVIYDYPEHHLIAEAIQAMWKTELNIAMTITPIAGTEYWDVLSRREFDLSSYIWIGDYVDPGTFLDLFEEPTAIGATLTGWHHQGYTNLVRQARVTVNPVERLRLYAEAEKLLIDEAPIIPFRHGVGMYLVHPSVSGISPNLMMLHPLKHVKIAQP